MVKTPLPEHALAGVFLGQYNYKNKGVYFNVRREPL